VGVSVYKCFDQLIDVPRFGGSPGQDLQFRHVTGSELATPQMISALRTGSVISRQGYSHG
jgi:hypothetical protein